MNTSLTTDLDPFMSFNRNQTGHNPDFPGLHYHCVPYGDVLLTRGQKVALSSPPHQIGRDNDTMHFSCIKINWQHFTPDTSVLVVMLQFSVTTEAPLTTPYLIQQIVRQTPSTQPILVINNPGMLGSSRIPRSTRIDLRAGVFQSLAESVLISLKRAGIDRMTLVGFSMGARLALAMGAVTVRWDNSHLFPAIHAIAAAEPPGLQSYSFIEFFNRFTNIEGERLSYYQTSTTDEGLKDCIDPNQSQVAQALRFLKAVLPDWKGNWALMTGMRRDTLPVDLEILEDSDIPTTLIQGTRSAISARFHAPLGSVKLRLLPGDSHAFGEEGRRLAYHLLDSIRDRDRSGPPQMVQLD